MIKQVIRYKTFETNSSSYHTLSIYKRSAQPVKKEIIKGQDLVINNHINYKTIGDTESYVFVGTSSYEKAQMVLRFIGYELDSYFDNNVDDSLYSTEDRGWDWNIREKLFKDMFYDFPLIKAFVNAVKRYIGEDKNVTIEFNNSDQPYIEAVYNESAYTYQLFKVEKEDLTNVDKMTDVFYDIIFNPDIEMSEECDSNE